MLTWGHQHPQPPSRDEYPFSEAQFNTLKCCLDFLERFGSLEASRVFCQACFLSYNGEHHYSGIGLMTPAAVHDGRASAVGDVRQRVLRAVYAAHPERFVMKSPQPPVLPHAVWSNPPKEPPSSQDHGGNTISPLCDRRNIEPHGGPSEALGVSPHAITTLTGGATVNANGKRLKRIGTFRL